VDDEGGHADSGKHRPHIHSVIMGIMSDTVLGLAAKRSCRAQVARISSFHGMSGYKTCWNSPVPQLATMAAMKSSGLNPSVRSLEAIARGRRSANPRSARSAFPRTLRQCRPTSGSSIGEMRLGDVFFTHLLPPACKCLLDRDRASALIARMDALATFAPLGAVPPKGRASCRRETLRR
jgi:hypothetical protein